ncbi:hypothetical protein ABTM15_20090, partial [Acinetobacter baumannii]
RVDGLVTRFEQGKVALDTSRIERRVSRLERMGRRLIAAVVFAALLITGAVLHLQDPVFGTVVMIVSVVPFLGALIGGRR